MIDVKKFAFLNLKLAVFHRVYNHKKLEKKNPTLSGKVIRFNEANQDKSKFLKGELTKVIYKTGNTISFKDTGSDPDKTPSIIRDLFLKLDDDSIKDDEKIRFFLEKSKLFAKKLDSFHDGRIPGGILAIMYGHFELTTDQKEALIITQDANNKSNKQILIIAKIEEEMALQVMESNENDVKNIDIRLVDKLIMLHHANVMKAGVFYNE